MHNGFEFIKNYASLIKEETQTRRMPLGGSLSTFDIEAIACWINNGSLNN